MDEFQSFRKLLREISKGFHCNQHETSRPSYPLNAGYSSWLGYSADQNLADTANPPIEYFQPLIVHMDSALVGIDLYPMLRGADLVMTAEGAIDFQPPKGKVPAELARWVHIRGVPMVALVGNQGRGCRDCADSDDIARSSG